LAADFLFFEEESDDLPVGVVASEGVDLGRFTAKSMHTDLG